MCILFVLTNKSKKFKITQYRFNNIFFLYILLSILQISNSNVLYESIYFGRIKMILVVSSHNIIHNSNYQKCYNGLVGTLIYRLTQRSLNLFIFQTEIFFELINYKKNKTNFFQEMFSSNTYIQICTYVIIKLL